MLNQSQFEYTLDVDQALGRVSAKNPAALDLSNSPNEENVIIIIKSLICLLVTPSIGQLKKKTQQ